MRALVIFCLLIVAVSAAPEKLTKDHEAIMKALLHPHFKKLILQQTLLSKNGLVPSVLEDKILDFLNEIRAGMGQPNEELGLPALDPLNIEHVDLNFQNDFAEIQGTLDKIVVLDLHKFIVDNVQLIIVPLTFNIGMTLPSLNVKGLYDIPNGNLIGTLPFFGAGIFEVQVTDFSFNASAKIGLITGTQYLNITQLDISFHLGNLHVNFEGLEGGGGMGDLVNDIINDIGTEKINEYEPQLSAWSSVEIVILINKVLNTLTFQDILNMLG